MMQVPRKHAELFWPRVVMRKWLNINSKESNFSADESDLRDENEREEEYYNSDDSQAENGDVDGDGDDKEVDEAWLQSNVVESIPRRRRRNSETFRTQYINTKELRHGLCKPPV